ncbi:hypothetical protein JCM5805K_2919 [Lactococcus lactis subsp. lactis]|uniref:Uncharacterized protein n=1 Tax=Lactococcus lactis subsp. lactis TaxID=1360 RepID=A0A0B8QNY6_LACLL|nr:hypothetical protein JCM5805K_2919 [Lactococcus lactis subsp. lactis]
MSVVALNVRNATFIVPAIAEAIEVLPMPGGP